tara:strand:- start:2321 stop:2926 length:606 start_codon:yes stop_codon:yes gene_type:complete
MFQYSEANQFRFPDIELSEGEDLLIMGESGVGKTTLLHLIAGVLKPQSGSVELSGVRIHELSTAKKDRFRGRHIGLVFQRPHFVQALSLKDNLALVQYLAGEKPNSSRIREVLNSLGIEHKMNEKPNRLSIGEQQRASIALAVMNHPDIILADEPTSSLDDKNCNRVVELLKQQALSSNAQLIVITHDNRLKPHFQNKLQL